MKKTTHNRFLGILAVAALLTFAVGCPPPPTVYVDDDSTCTTGCGDAANLWPTIAEGLAAAAAGDIVHVRTGIYAESELSIPVDNLRLEGEGTSATFVDNGGAAVTAIRVLGRTGVTLSSLAIRNNAQGIRVDQSGGTPTTNLTISGCAFFNNDPSSSIEMTHASNVMISNSTFDDDNANGAFRGSVHLGDGVSSTTVSGCTFTDGEIGVMVRDGAHADISGCSFDNMFRNAIWFSGGPNGRAGGSATGNLMQNSPDNGVFSAVADTVIVTGNTIVSNVQHGVLIVDTESMIVENNVAIQNNGLFGIRCEGDPSDVTCSNNNISGNGSGSIDGCPASCVD